MSFGASIIERTLDRWTEFRDDALDNFYGFSGRALVTKARFNMDAGAKLNWQTVWRNIGGCCRQTEHFQMQVIGMMKAEGYEVCLHCRRRWPCRASQDRGRSLLFARANVLSTSANFDIAANVAVDELLLPKLLPTPEVFSVTMMNAYSCATGPKARERRRLRIHRATVTQVNSQLFFGKRRLRKNSGILYEKMDAF